MAFKVLVVDDSGFFQVRLKEMIERHPELTVVGVAANGHEAIEFADKLKPDIISMDYEMPYLDGVSAVRAIMAARPVPIVMVSSMTYEGARITLDALAAGAVDFIPKNFAEVSRNSENLQNKLHNTFLNFLRKDDETNTSVTQQISSKKTLDKIKPEPPIGRSSHIPVSSSKKDLKNKIRLVILGVSTGGPVALSEVIQSLPEQFRVPIVVVQHMPENFTKALAERLDSASCLSVKEAANGDALLAGRVLIAPGGYQLMFGSDETVKIISGDDRVNYKPSVDITFGSAANHFGSSVLGIVMTGMGADGCEGARLIKKKGGHIWGQDKSSSVIYGMPKAVANAHLTDEILSLSEIGPHLVRDLQ